MIAIGLADWGFAGPAELTLAVFRIAFARWRAGVGLDISLAFGGRRLASIWLISGRNGVVALRFATHGAMFG